MEADLKTNVPYSERLIPKPTKGLNYGSSNTKSNIKILK